MSCGEAGKIEKLKKELKEKKQELASVNKEILDLQTEIDLLDTTAKENTIPVKVDTLGHSKFSNMVTLQGLVKSDKNIRMSSEVPGRIEKIYVREGQKVSFGQALVKMNSEMISSQINELKSALKLAQATYEKQNRLWQKEIGSEIQLLQAKTNYENLQKAIETNSLWENLVQLTDNLDDYSIFHQVINRSEKDNTMDILFVASKLTDINNYTSIIKNSGLNPVIIDVKCFALKSAVDQINQISKKTEDTNFTALLEFGLDENYVMILYNNNPIITDIFLRGQDRKILKESKDQEEKDALVRRFMTQVKQAVQDFETKYEKRIRNLKVTSNLVNVEDYLASFRKNMTNTGYQLFDPFDGIKIPAQLENEIKMQNRSYFSTVMGLAFRKLDVFGYYKFVTAVKNINLLPNRDNMIAQKKAKAVSSFAFKGVVGIVAIIYITLFGFSFWQISELNKKIVGYEEVVQSHELKTLEKNKYAKEIGVMNKSLKLSQSITSNKTVSFRVLAQIASSVPKRVKFKSIEYNGVDQIVIEGSAFSDQDILKLISNLNNKKLISQASLASMTLPEGQQQGSQKMKGFKIACILESA